MPFQDRRDAGRQLAVALASHIAEEPIVLALPRGGVPVAAEVAKLLHAPLNLLIVRKIGLPQQPELAMGALVEGEPPLVVRNQAVIDAAGVSKAQFDKVRDHELVEARRRRSRYLGHRPAPKLAGRVVIVVDDGIATGASMRAALKAARVGEPRRIILAVPVAARDTIEALRAEADDIVCLETPPDLGAIGLYYANFDQVTDEEVVAALQSASSTRP